MNSINTDSIIKQAENEIAAEDGAKAKAALKTKLRMLGSARQVVANLERDVEDLKRSIEDGSFVG